MGNRYRASGKCVLDYSEVIVTCSNEVEAADLAWRLNQYENDAKDAHEELFNARAVAGKEKK